MPGPVHLVRLRIAGLAATTLMAVGAYRAGATPGADPDAALGPTGSLADSWPYWLGLAAWLIGLITLTVAWWRLGRIMRRHQVSTSVSGRVSASASASGRVSASASASASGRVSVSGAPPVSGPVSLRWLLVTGALWAVPLLVAPPMGSRDVYAYACQGAVWLDGTDPYTEGVAAGGCPWVETVPPLWRDTPTPYGPLAVALAGAVVAVARMVATSIDGQLLVAIGLFRAVALAGSLLVAWYVPRLARLCGVDPVAATWLGLVSPLVAVHVVAGVHNDALLVGLLLAALALAAVTLAVDQRLRRHMVLVGAGVALGLAVAIKVTALVALPFVVLLATVGSPRSRARSQAMSQARSRAPSQALLRARSRARSRAPSQALLRARLAVAARASAAVTTGAVLTFAGLSLVTGLDLGWLGALRNTGELVQWTSLPTGLGMAAGYLLRLVGQPEAFDTAVTVARALGFATLAVVSTALVVRAWRAAAEPGALGRRGVLAAGGSAFAALAVLSPVFYPWYGLTAIALLAGAVADHRWQRRLAGMVVVLSFLVLPNGQGVAALTKLPGALLDVVLVGTLVVVTLRQGVSRGVRKGPFLGKKR
ncbi:polyprenol phosphomannose-dependent alpha 1,6 mannosyltransferase MptB [Micromonospora sp. NPDC003197]